MGIQVALSHRTHYRYKKAISLGPQVIQLRPALHCRTPILSYSLEVTPANHHLYWQLDPHHNRRARVLFPEKTSEFAVDVNLVADISPSNPFDFLLEPGFEEFPFKYSAETARDLQVYLSVDTPGPLLQAYLEQFRGIRDGSINFLLHVNRKVQADIGYVTRLEPGVQSCEETLQARTGSCRDSSWLLVEMLRNLGIAARFVSGYLIQLASAEENAPKADSADLHAWAEAYLPGAGWIGLDPTSGMAASEGHIPLVCMPTAVQAAPIEGTVELADTAFSYSLTVRRLNEAAEPGRPFTEAAWQRVRELAHGIDRDLAVNDVRLTMGAEPTFVGVETPESPQWNIDALGDEKRTQGMALIRGLREQMAPGALLHFGQGKWYPGEPLPRWALSCYWRTDGVPVWKDVRLIANEEQDDKFGVAEALKFTTALTRRLQVSSENILPAFEPGTDSTEPAGYIVPIRRRQPEGQIGWSSQLWFPRPERLELLAGDSPIGYRISTDSIPWVAPDELEYVYEAAPLDDHAVLPLIRPVHMELFAAEPKPDPLPAVARDAETAPELIRPSLCVQAREGRLHVFLPYAPVLADYLDLVAAVEDTAKHLKMPVWVEGYAPASDPRLRNFSVTPDPGVLEVNLPPASSWDELEEINRVLDEETRRNRLTTEKLAYDGSEMATGGGCHIVIGGATLFDSPILRRPDLLRSMLIFWQNHPALSYLFSGMYVGPTSQCPRVDEARLDALYELEVAFRHLPQGDCPAYVVDGLFRNLLADVTGNTHRAEFCVDKLFAPKGFGLQLGLLELRAFEMAPHVRMTLLQMLLIRGLVCMFWKTPFDGKLIRWGTELHDRFMLPDAAKRDLFDVLGQLRRSSIDFEEDWFAAHLEFRFPKIGSIFVEGVELELRHALEPWNVLPEETVSGGTVRSVDSSLERIQVKLTGQTRESRYVVACNGRRVPLHPTPENGVEVAGVRFRARRLSETLHPTIPVHAPLVFNVIDRFKGRSIGQCTYFVAPPDGRIYPGRPVSAGEAKERRLERFQASLGAPVQMETPEEETNSIFPSTLDLRLPPAGKSGARTPGTES